MLITVFTPTYNRAHLLLRLYESLCRQTFKDFEWVIVDDGSVDDTKDVIDKLKIENGELKINQQFPVRYFYQENGGKHRAINHGVMEAKGELFLILDSDDALPPVALETVNSYYEQIKDNKSFAGVSGMMAHENGGVIGNGFNFDALDTNAIDLRYKYNVSGDMAEVFRTEVLREIPFPEIKGEKFSPEALTWNRIAQKYKLRYFNKVIYIRDYLDGGLTDKIVKIRMDSPIASMMTYAELNSYEIPFSSKAKAAINYWRFRLCYKGNGGIPQLPWYWNWVMPLGWLMHLNDMRKPIR